ncbi:MAG: 50S ribosomal protein L21 [candidate division Zixibacteria bacterium]|nr:50S ribosomal protein L21 [candidate division Zixibacteria bacterium]
MRAIIESGGMQFPIEQEAVIQVPKLNVEAGQKCEFDKVLLVSGDNKFAVGKPYIDGASVKGEVLSHGKSDKVKVFKFKRRRKYRKTTGHRQQYTEVKILNISA